MHGRKLYKIHEIALDMGVPLIGLNDSPGARVLRPDERLSYSRLRDAR